MCDAPGLTEHFNNPEHPAISAGCSPSYMHSDCFTHLSRCSTLSFIHQPIPIMLKCFWIHSKQCWSLHSYFYTHANTFQSIPSMLLSTHIHPISYPAHHFLCTPSIILALIPMSEGPLFLHRHSYDHLNSSTIILALISMAEAPLFQPTSAEVSNMAESLTSAGVSVIRESHRWLGVSIT